MNKKNIIIIISSVVIVFVIILLIVFLVKDNNNVVKPDLPPVVETPTMSDEEFINTEEGRDISISLSNYGYEIYNNQTYLELAKNQSGVYYATKKDLVQLNYDVSIIHKSCKDDDAIIFFDIDKKMNDNYNDLPPVVFKITCQ